MRQRVRRSLSVFLAFAWGIFLLLAGAASGAPGTGAAPASVTASAASGSQHGGHARSSHARQESRRAVAPQDATAAAPHEVRPPSHPVSLPVLTAASHVAPPALKGRATAGPEQERAPPRPAHSPRVPRGPPATPSS